MASPTTATETDDAPNPCKKQKHSKSSDAIAAVSRLPNLLKQLTGEDLSLFSLSAIQVNVDTLKDEQTTSLHYQDIVEHQESLFEKHLGKRKEILAEAIRYANRELEEAIRAFNEHNWTPYQIWEHECHPQQFTIKGPKVNTKVWVEIFLGRERSETLFEGVLSMNDPKKRRQEEESNSRNYDNDTDLESLVYKTLQEDIAKNLSVMELLTNALEYLRYQASITKTPADLLRFCVLYGLDGAMNDVIKGSYHHNDEEENESATVLTIDTLLPLSDKPRINDVHPEFSDREMFLPAYAIGAILGHVNIFTKVLKELGGNIDTAIGYMGWSYENKRRQYDEFDQHVVPSMVLMWVITTNQQNVLRCLVADCGFQFRWIMPHEWDNIQTRLWSTDQYESKPFWRGNLGDEFEWASSRGRRQMRSTASYKEQMNMVEVLIELGLPLEFFGFPTKEKMELEMKLQKENKLETEQDCRTFRNMHSKKEWKARDKVWEACCCYNSMQKKERDTLHLADFYFQKIKARWDKQTSVQQVRLPEYEALDPSWRNNSNGNQDDDDDDDEEDDEESD